MSSIELSFKSGIILSFTSIEYIRKQWRKL